jgi:hypothetical protein
MVKVKIFTSGADNTSYLEQDLNEFIEQKYVPFCNKYGIITFIALTAAAIIITIMIIVFVLLLNISN